MEDKRMKATVVLKTGEKFNAAFREGREFSSESLTVGTVQSIALEDGGFLIVQGDNISHIVSHKGSE
jgi:hypothetical protein